MLHKEFKDAQAIAKYPKKMWVEMNEHQEKMVGNFTEEDKLAYVQCLYNISGSERMDKRSQAPNADMDCFTLQDVKKAMAHTRNGKAWDSSGVYGCLKKV